MFIREIPARSFDFVAKILDHRVAQELPADPVEAGSEFGGVGAGDLELDELAHPGAPEILEPETFEGMAHGGPLWIEHVSLGSDEYVDFHGPLKANDDAVKPKTVKGF
jgi:hypothetical protein